MKQPSLAIAASLLTIVALAPRCAAARATNARGFPADARTAGAVAPETGVAILAQNDQMYMQQENSGDNADTGDQSPPDDQSVDTDTGDAAEPQAAAPQDNNAGAADPDAAAPDAAQPGYDGAGADGDSGSDASGAGQEQPPEAQP